MSYEKICQTCAFQHPGSTNSYETEDGSRIVVHSEPSGPCEENIADYAVGEDGLMTFHPRPKSANWKSGLGNSNPRGVEQ
jgi:hypothetical protein